MRFFCILILIITFLDPCLRAQTTAPDSLYLGAGWESGQQAVYQMERFTHYKNAGIERYVSDEHHVSFQVREKTEDHHRISFQVDSTLRLKQDAAEEDKLFNALFTELTFEYLTEPDGRFRTLDNSEEIFTRVRSFFKEEAAQLADGKEIDQTRMALLQMIYSSPEETQNLLLDYVGDLYSLYGFTFPLDEEYCWEEARPNQVTGDLMKVEACETLTDWDPEYGTVEYRYRSVIDREAATKTILSTMEQTVAKNISEEKRAEMRTAMQNVSYEIIDSGAMTIHYPSGWILESLWQQNVITYEKGREPFERITGAKFKLLDIQKGSNAQTEQAEAAAKKELEEMPRFPGCEDLPDLAQRKPCADRKMLEFVYGNIRYPKPARRKGVEGICVVSFVVEKDGRLSNIRLRRDIGAGCGEEVLRVVNLMNEQDIRWIPGKQDGEVVRVEFNLPVQFKLE